MQTKNCFRVYRFVFTRDNTHCQHRHTNPAWNPNHVPQTISLEKRQNHKPKREIIAADSRSDQPVSVAGELRAQGKAMEREQQSLAN
jgi:hypothetical protein